jgi:hypothetical protein
VWATLLNYWSSPTGSEHGLLMLQSNLRQSRTSMLLYLLLYRCLCSTRVTGLSNVLRDIECVLRQQELTDWQKKALLPVLEECHNVLIALGKVVDENYCLKTLNSSGLRDRSRRVWKRLTWEPNDIQDLRSRIALNIGLLNAFNGSLTKCFSVPID